MKTNREKKVMSSTTVLGRFPMIEHFFGPTLVFARQYLEEVLEGKVTQVGVIESHHQTRLMITFV
jgi:hypothetical protein